MGPDLAWISMVIVRDDHRRRGIATVLLERCADEIGASGRVAGLAATAAGREVLGLWRTAGVPGSTSSRDGLPGL